MKTQLKRSLIAKCAAFLLTVILLVGGVLMLCSAGCALLFSGAQGTVGAARERVAEVVLYHYAEELAQRYDWDPDLKGYEDMPFTYHITDEDGKVLAGNYVGGDYLASSTYYHWYVEWQDENHFVEKGLYVTLYADADMRGEGWLPLAVNAVTMWHGYRWLLLCLGGACLLTAAVVMVFLHAAVGWRERGDSPQCNAFDRIPFDLFVLAYVGLAALEVILLDVALTDLRLYFPLFGIAAVIVNVPLLLSFTISLATRIKTRTLWHNTLTGRILRFLRRSVLLLVRQLPLVWKTVAVTVVLGTVEFLFILHGEMDNVAIFWLVEKIILVPLTVLFVIGLRRLQYGVGVIAAGQVDHQIDTQYLVGDLRCAAEDINHISDGLSGAVEARLKSERFKTELITNVSHDIKTPLTSIINYVDLLEKEKPENERMQEYLEILDRQSARLKKLIEDLVEASKASTGNLPVNMSQCQLNVLLEQVTGEYTEKAAAAALDLRVSVPEQPVTVQADGRHMWRIFDNLMNNICKYAQPNTRVYLDLKAADGEAQVIFRNISRNELHVSEEELMERFVRGDSARNTEGSGLGLSIARSLTELQNGRMSLAVDGDLFKVMLTFPLAGGESV